MSLQLYLHSNVTKKLFIRYTLFSLTLTFLFNAAGSMYEKKDILNQALNGDSPVVYIQVASQPNVKGNVVPLGFTVLFVSGCTGAMSL